MSFFPVTDWTPEEDPILGLNEAFCQDNRSHKVNLGVGSYKTAQGAPLVLSSVRKAEALLYEAGLDKEYLPIDGLKGYLSQLSSLVFGEKVPKELLYGSQAIGGTGALRLGLDYFKLSGPRKVYLSNPSWTNHFGICSSLGLEAATYTYYDPHSAKLDFERLCKKLSELEAGSLILLHASCHNPTGIDPTREQWIVLEELLRQRELIPFFDLAYQGLGDGLEEDAFALRYFAEQGHELAVAVSNSKNFGLYGERVGALFMLTRQASAKELVGKQMRHLIRGNYSSPPLQGARLVAKILSDPALRKEWEEELREMRQRVEAMRGALVARLAAETPSPLCQALSGQKGLFSYGLLKQSQVAQLRAQFAIYLPQSGRINVAGLNESNLDYVVNALAAVGA